MFVYVLRSLKDGRRYVGISSDVDKRLLEHNSGEVTSTRNRRPFVLIHVERVNDHLEARLREKYFKTAAGRRYLRELESKEKDVYRFRAAPPEEGVTRPTERY